jgi:hypothetical protein
MSDQISGFRMSSQLRLKLPQGLIVGDPQHLLGEGLQLNKTDGHKPKLYEV